jgi:NAD-dependent dihydropyrimidine dehydrogenase PreA subunit
MNDDMYEQLADALDRLPSGFPRTPPNVEIDLLKKMFSWEEASIAHHMSRNFESIDVIAKRVGLSAKEVWKRLMRMTKRGLLWFDEDGPKPGFRLAPFMIGMIEDQILGSRDKELAHLAERYMAEGGAAGIMKPNPALHRVLPAQNTVKSDWVLPYDDARAILLGSEGFRARDCMCRIQQDLISHRRCSFPLRNCLIFSSESSITLSENEISQDEALAILDETEEIGLVHTVSNVGKGIGYICNCCGCCCEVLRGITDWGIENSVAAANYYAVINPDECVGCGQCIERCQVHAISEQEGVAIVELKRCIGCGLCVTGCSNNVARLERKPEAEIVHPPEDSAAWEDARLRSRGLIE